jgi:hypothetical protein
MFKREEEKQAVPSQGFGMNSFFDSVFAKTKVTMQIIWSQCQAMIRIRTNYNFSIINYFSYKQLISDIF